MSKKVRVRKVFEYSIIYGEGFEREALIIARNKRRAIKRFKRESEQNKVDDIEEVDVYWKKGNKIYWDRECTEEECEDTRWKAKMKFYEFGSDYEYYALIGATTKKDAIKEYCDCVIRYSKKEYDEEYLDCTPIEVTKEYAKDEFARCLIQQGEEPEKTAEDFKKGFDKMAENEDTQLFLTDGESL